MSKPKKLIIFISLFTAVIVFLSFQINSQAKQVPLQRTQEQIDRYNKVQKIVADFIKLDVPEYVGMEIDDTEVSLDIWISSEPIKELLAFMQGFDVSGKDQPLVRLHRSPYTLKNLKEAQKKLESMVKNSQIGGGVVLSLLGTNTRGKGLDISLDVSSATPDEQWISNLEEQLGVPVLINPEKTDIDLLFTDQ
jgi:hypothetical protein